MANNFDITDIVEELIPSMLDNVKDDIKNFEDLVNLDGALTREIYLGDIVEGTGTSVYGIINFWNKYDENNNIPVEERKPIKIYIDSCGGQLTDTFVIIDAIKKSKTPVWTVCLGTALSGGFFSFIAGHKRIACSHSSFLFHEGSASTSGTSGQFENYTAYYKKQLDQLKQLVLENTKITEDEYEKIRRDDVWYTAEEALEKGICDELMEDLI